MLSRALGTKPSWIDKFIRTLLRATDANVIAVDWVYGSTGNYLFAVENVVKLSLEISRFLSKLLVGRERFRSVLYRMEYPQRKRSPWRSEAGEESLRKLVGFQLKSGSGFLGVLTGRALNLP